MPDNCELNYEALFGALAKRFEDYLKADEEYFALLETVSKGSKCTNAILSNLFRIPKIEQVKLLRHMAEMALICEALNDKYHLLPKESEDSEA